MRLPFQVMEAALAKMVMPRSRSWSLESMTRSTRAACVPNVPVVRRSASTRVVLPWSTCATSATFLREGVFISCIAQPQGLSVVLVVFFFVVESPVLLSDRGILVLLGGRVVTVLLRQKAVERGRT